MSKPVVRVVLAVLISLAIIAAVAPSVQARLGSVLPNAREAASDQAVGRTSFSARGDSYYQFDDMYKDFHGGCEDRDPSVDD